MGNEFNNIIAKNKLDIWVIRKKLEKAFYNFCVKLKCLKSVTDLTTFWQISLSNKKSADWKKLVKLIIDLY